MNWYSTPPEPEILWIKNLDQLNDRYPYSSRGKKFVFAKYEVVDITHDNKIVKVTASPRKAEERVAKQLAYKKHAKCEVIVRENDLQAKLSLDLSNVYGTDAYNKKFERSLLPETLNRDVIVVDRNINMVLKITGVELDKFIITKAEKEMRLTILNVEDRNGGQTTMTLFDNDLVDKISENQFIKITNAEVNMRKYRDSEESRPEGLKVPSWSKLELIDAKVFEVTKESEIPEPIVNTKHVDEEVRCEQVHCRGQGKDRQYFCVKCNMELCSICIFEHRKDTSISGLECDDEICYGSRLENTGAEKVIEN